MFGENKNLKDFSNSSKIDSALSGDKITLIKDSKISYTKTNKLIIALYMVTDIINKDEIVRNKLRTLGSEILSDIHNLSFSIETNTSLNLSLIKGKIVEVFSFLDIASTVSMISEMNANILRKEFFDLSKSLDTYSMHLQDNESSLSQFFLTNNTESVIETEPAFTQKKELPRSALFTHMSYKGHDKGHIKSSHNIGLQKGGTLMKALSDKTSTVQHSDSFDILKKERRFEIIKIIKDLKQATIKDIKESKNPTLKSCGEKTLQRELISMVKDGVLNKIGEKRWSKYSLK